MMAVQAFSAGQITQEEFTAQSQAAIRQTIHLFEATGSPVITDGEQTKSSFVTYPIDGLPGLAPDGVVIPFADGHVRRLPRLTQPTFRYQVYADAFLKEAQKYAHVPVKQAVISASALSLLYPQEGIDGYPREAFLEDLLRENEADIRRCLEGGAHRVQIDFSEGRLAVKLDPTRQLLDSFVALNNQVLERFSAEERACIGIHTCPGGDHDSTHSADVDYADLLPSLFDLQVGSFYIQLASEPDRGRVLGIIQKHLRQGQRVFVGVIDPINSDIETSEQVKDRVLEAAQHIPLDCLGTTDDCGFSPFGDDTSTAREIAFAKIRSRIAGTALAAQLLGL